MPPRSDDSVARTDSVSFRVLGRLSVAVGSTPVALPRSQVLQGLLGALLLAQGEPLRIERLTRLVWADRAEMTSRESVHVGVSRLRKWLGRAGGGCPAIGYEDGYRLVVADADLDLHRFRSLVDQARALDEPERRAALLLSALELRRGPVLDGLDHLDRTDVLVRSVEQDVREAVMSLASMPAHIAAPDRAIAAVRALTEELPFDEPLHAALIELLASNGWPAAALMTYHQLSDRLLEELGVDPSEQVQAAYLRVLAEDGPVAAASPPRAAPPAPMPVPAQLPPDIPDFTGRADEIAQIIESLVGTAGGRRTVAVTTVTGMGGIGKTALAVRVAHALTAAFPDGQLYVDLRGDGGVPIEPAEVLGRFLHALGMSGSGIPPTLAERTALFRSRVANRRILVVLDDSASEDQVRPLLPGSPGTAVLITGRRKLIGLEGATHLTLDTLPPQQALELLGRIVGERRVAAEPDSAEEITRLCGRMPLAVRIVGARLVGRPQWTLAHLVEVLRDGRSRLDELVVGDLAVRASLETSYRPLPCATRRAFRMIGLLDVPDFAAWTVAALLGEPPDDVCPHLETLIDAQLISVVGTRAVDEPRYRVHELVRLYARWLSTVEDTPEQRTAALARALGGWLWLAERAADGVPGPAYATVHGTAPRWPVPVRTAGRLLADPVRWFNVELPALLVATRQACDLEMDELAWDLAASLEKYCDVKGVHDPWRRTHERALRLCRAARNKRGEAVLLRGLLEVTTWTSADQSGPAMATMRETAGRVLELFTELGDVRGMADAMTAIAWTRLAQGDEEAALTAADRALRLSESVDYLGGQARALQMTAIAHGEDRPWEALPRLEQALKIAEMLGNPRLKATIVQFLGVAHALVGDTVTGERMLDEAVAMARELGDAYLETYSLIYLAKLFTALGDDRAAPTAELALGHSRAGNFKHHLAESLAILGELHLGAGDVPKAVRLLEEAVRVWRSRGWLTYLARTLRTFGRALDAAGDIDGARAACAEADEISRSIRRT